MAKGYVNIAVNSTRASFKSIVNFSDDLEDGNIYAVGIIDTISVSYEELKKSAKPIVSYNAETKVLKLIGKSVNISINKSEINCDLTIVVEDAEDIFNRLFKEPNLF